MTNTSRPYIKNYLKIQFSALLLSCAFVGGCATEKTPAQGNGTSVAAQLPFDLVTILAKFAELDVSSPLEKFELYFKTVVEKYPYPNVKELFAFKSKTAADASMFGSGYVNTKHPDSDQLINIELSRSVECISPTVMLKKLPMLVKSPETGSSIVSTDELKRVAFRSAYSIRNKYGYVSYRFEEDKCLREVGVSQKTLINP